MNRENCSWGGFLEAMLVEDGQLDGEDFLCTNLRRKAEKVEIATRFTITMSKRDWSKWSIEKNQSEEIRLIWWANILSHHISLIVWAPGGNSYGLHTALPEGERLTLHLGRKSKENRKVPHSRK